MREIVKRETIETSIVLGRSASNWVKPVGRALGQVTSQHQFGLPERG